MKIRPIQPKDHSAILEVASALSDWFDADARNRAIPTDLRHQQGFVALEEERVCGFITFYVAEGRLLISWLGVRPEDQRRGIGARLLGYAEEFGRAHGLEEIGTYTLGDSVDYEPYEATRRFYARQGFGVYQRSKTDNPGCPEEIRLKKAISQPGAAANALRASLS